MSDEKVAEIKPVVGTVFNLKDLNPGTWFDVEGGGRICLRVCGADKLREIRKQTVKKQKEYKNGQRFVFEETNEDLQSKLIWDYCIVTWENFLDAAGKPIPCNAENKSTLMGNSPFFSKIVANDMKKLAVEENEDEELEKN